MGTEQPAGYKVSLLVAIEAADTVQVDGYQVRYRAAVDADYVHLTLYDQTQRLGDGFKTFLLASKTQAIALQDGAAQFRDTEGRAHAIVFYKNRRLTPQDIGKTTLY